MIRMKSSIIGFVLGLLVLGCSHIIDSGDPAASWTAEVHLQGGLERHWVSVVLNNMVQYEGYLRHPDFPAQPLVTFELDMRRGARQVSILQVPINGNERARISVLEIPAGDQEFYFIGLTVAGNSLRLAVQENPIPYV